MIRLGVRECVFDPADRVTNFNECLGVYGVCHRVADQCDVTGNRWRGRRDARKEQVVRRLSGPSTGRTDAPFHATHQSHDACSRRTDLPIGSRERVYVLER